MPLALPLVIIDVMLVVHAVRTGRASPWVFIILLVPVVGAIAYVVAVLVPDLTGSRQGRQAQRTIAKALNPEKRYRELSDAVEIADTIANRAALAEECLGLERFEEAKRHFEVILARPMGNEPVYLVGRARAQFALDQAADTLAILDDLRARFPDYQSADAHLLYARALEACARHDEALQEYRALSDYFVGAGALRRAARPPRAPGGGQGLADRSPDPVAPRARPCAASPGGMDRACRKGRAFRGLAAARGVAGDAPRRGYRARHGVNRPRLLSR